MHTKLNTGLPVQQEDLLKKNRIKNRRSFHEVKLHSGLNLSNVHGLYHLEYTTASTNLNNVNWLVKKSHIFAWTGLLIYFHNEILL